MPTTKQNDTGIVWQDPPAKGSGRPGGKHVGLTDELREHPNQWALVRANSSGAAFAQQIKKAVLVGFEPAGAFESRAVSLGAGRYDIYARYVGEQS